MPMFPNPRLRRALALVACAVAVATAEGTPSPEILPPATALARATAAPLIDGKLDDACWLAVPAIPIDHPNGKGKPRAVSSPAEVRYAWDEHHLYIAYETFDRNLVAKGSGDRQGPTGNQRDGCSIWEQDVPVDVVEFFISLGDQRFFWELHHNARNQFNDVWCVTTDKTWPIHQAQANMYGILFHYQEYLQDDGAFTVATATALKSKADGTPSTIAEGVGGGDVDTGYRAELRIPWATLMAPRDRAVPKQPGVWALDGFTIAVLGVVQDGDLAERYHRSAPFGADGWFHHDVAAWPRYRLGDAPAPAKP